MLLGKLANISVLSVTQLALNVVVVLAGDVTVAVDLTADIGKARVLLPP